MTPGTGVGAAAFERRLHHRHAVRAGPPELWRTLLRLEEETLGALRAAGRELEADWRDLLEERLESADAGLAPVSAGMRELRRLRMGGGDLLPQEADGLSVELVPEWQAPWTWPAAYVAPPLDGEGPGRLLLTDGRWMRVCLSPIVAELGLPGLHLQAMVARRSAREVRRMSDPSRRAWWGLHALDVLERAGCWASPGERLVVAAHRLFRVVLARVDVGVHTRQLTVEEGIAALLDRLPVEPGEAQAAVRGVLLAPAEAAGTVAGWQELRGLLADRERTAGFSGRAFHDQVLGFGALAAPLVRWGIEMGV